jgi:hypothetical protein
MLKKRSLRWLIQDEPTFIRWQEIDETEQIRRGEASKDLLKHTVSTSVRHQPVMNNSSLHCPLLLTS